MLMRLVRVLAMQFVEAKYKGTFCVCLRQLACIVPLICPFTIEIGERPLTKKYKSSISMRVLSGGQGQNRTADTGIFSCDLKP